MANRHPAHKKEGTSLGETLCIKLWMLRMKNLTNSHKKNTYLHYRIKWVEKQPGYTSSHPETSENPSCNISLINRAAKIECTSPQHDDKHSRANKKIRFQPT